MFRHWPWLLLIILLVTIPRGAVHSQPKPQAPAAQQQGGGLGALSPEQARAALDTLNDPKKRAAFSATLEALVKSQSEKGQPDLVPPPPAPPGESSSEAPASAPQPATPGEGIAIQLAPDSLGAQVLLTASAFLNDIANELPRAIKAAQSVPLLWGWLVVMVTHPLGQHLLADAAWRLIAVVVLAEGFALSLRYLLRRPMARVLRMGESVEPTLATEEEDHQSSAEIGAIEGPVRRFDGAGRRIALGLGRFALQMVPVIGFLIAGHAAAGSSLGGVTSTRLIILAALDAIAACQTLLAILTLLFMPDPPGLKLFPMRPSAGSYLMRWGRRLILIGVPGYAVGEIGLLLGLSAPAHGALQKLVGLALTICLGIIVLQRRRAMRRWLSAPPEATGFLAQARTRLARYWHLIALFFLAASWLTWTVRTPDAIARTVWYMAMTIVVVIVASIGRWAVTVLLRPLQSQPPADAATPITVVSVRTRLGVYHPVLRRLARAAISVIAILALLQLYGLGSLSWLLTSDVGHRIASGIGTLVVTIGLAFAVWEGVNIAIQSHLESLKREAQSARSARLRTLLPLIRTTLAIAVAVVTGLMVLSEIGVNIAPLLAGAGIVGVAIGFGSQKLVQDVITGVFLLLENTMQVGDIVKVGDQSGLIESLSVRTIRLRTEDGSVVVIPFSAVTTVVNMTRDYSRAVITANISIHDDVDAVIATMRDIVREMRDEDAWSTIILDELEVFGLDRFADTALQIKCRIMCTPFGRWSVGREFNRRMKSRFEVIGVTAPFSALKLIPHEPSEGWSPVREAVPAAQ